MSSFQQKITWHTKGKKQFEETEQAVEPDSNMAGVLESSDWQFEIL